MSRSASSASQRSSSNSATGATCWKPALATIVSSPPKRVDRRLDRGAVAVARRQVGGERLARAVRVGLEVDREHARAVVDERLGDRAADPARRAGDDRLPAHATDPTGSVRRAVSAARVLILSWEYPPIVEGGLARHVRKLSEQLVRDGVEVHVADARRRPPRRDARSATA